MSETLLAIFLVTSSAKGSDLVYRWPPLPEIRPRLTRPKPKDDVEGTHTDNPWRAANMTEDSSGPLIPHTEPSSEDEDDYFWRKPNKRRDRSLSFSHSRSHPTSRRPSPAKETNETFSLDQVEEQALMEEYNEVLGFSSEFLASLLCPQQGMCHQKFELIVDDLAFIGHPVCDDGHGKWRFKQEKTKSIPRGRGTKKGESPRIEDNSLTPEKASRDKQHDTEEGWLQTFHITFVIDLPDPSSYDSGNISQYFDVLYDQIAFPLAAVLYQEQVLHNFVEAECAEISSLEGDFISRGKSFDEFMLEATKRSSLALAMKTLYEAIKDNQIARLTIHDFAFELQLPPHLDELLHYDDDAELNHSDYGDDEDESGDNPKWGPEMSFKWHLPALTPWKALLRLDDGDQGFETYLNGRNTQLSSEDRELAGKLLSFLNYASIHLCFADMASVLDWDLETQIYPTVRWLVHHRRAKVIDTVHPGLKTLFTIVPKLPAPLSQLSEEFATVFGRTSVPPLPKLLSLISTNNNDQPANHFYANVVKSKDLIPLYHDVITWLLKHDLLVSLHLYIRLFVSLDLKLAFNKRRMKDMQDKKKLGYYAFPESSPQEHDGVIDASPVNNWLSMSPKTARKQTHQLSRPSSIHSPDDDSHAGKQEQAEDIPEDRFVDVSDDEQPEPETVLFNEFDKTQGDLRPQLIVDPGRATALENGFLGEMSEGKDPHIVKLFQKINRYFNGKCTDDEILYRADISRKQLREVLHHYEDHVQTYLHPVCN